MKNTSDEFEFKEINYPSCKQLFTAFLREAAYTVNVNNTNSDVFNAIYISTEQVYCQKEQPVLSFYLKLDDDYFGYSVVSIPKETDDNIIFFCSKSINKFIYLSVRFMFLIRSDKQLSDEQLMKKYTEYIHDFNPADKINCLTKASSGQPKAAPFVPH